MVTSSENAQATLIELRQNFEDVAATLMTLAHADRSKSIAQVTDVGHLIEKAEQRPGNRAVFNRASQALGYLRDMTKAQALLGTDNNLTGLPNRFAFNAQLDIAIKETGSPAKFSGRSHSQPESPEKSVNRNYFTLLFLDLDRFKGVNDDYGHDTGDEFLCAFADILRKITRKDEGRFFQGRSRASRLGGDEFAIILDTQAETPEQAKENFGHALTRIRKSLEAVHFEYNGKSFPIVSSVGMHIIEEGDTPESAMKEADIALYEAKRDKKERYDRSVGLLKEQGVQNITVVEDKRPQKVTLTQEEVFDVIARMLSQKAVAITSPEQLIKAVDTLSAELGKLGINVKDKPVPDQLPSPDADGLS